MRILRYIENNVIKSKNIDGNSIFNYPIQAIKEVIINAFYHRDYSDNTPIEVRIDNEKIVVVSYSRPDKFIKQEDINRGEVIARKYRNKRIGEALRILKLVSGRAMGLPKIMRSMKLNGSPEPVFETGDNRAFG